MAQSNSLVEDYEYMLALTKGIEGFTAFHEKESPDAFIYCGSDLRFVIERNLYFSLVHDTQLKTLYFEARAGKTINALYRKLCLHSKAIFPFMMDTIPHLSWIERIIQKCIISNVDKIKHMLKSVKAKPKSMSESKTIHTSSPTSSQGPKILFLVIHPKFVRYMKPLVEKLKDTTAYLTLSEDTHTQDYLYNQNLPSLCINVAVRSTLPRKISPVLEKFPYCCDMFDAVLETISEINPNCIVVPEGNAPINEVINRVGKLLSKPVLCIQQGWSPFIHSGFRNMSYTAMLVWGEKFTEMLKPFNPEQHYIEVGHHNLYPADNEQTLDSKMDMKDGNITIFLQKGGNLFSEATWIAFLEYIKWAALSFPNICFFLRDHPSNPLSQEELSNFENLSNIKFAFPEHCDLSDILKQSKISISIYSTTIIESIALNVVPLIINLTGLPHYWPNIAAENAGVEVKTLEEARLELQKLISEQDYFMRIKNNLPRVTKTLFSEFGEKSQMKICNILSATANQPQIFR